jgi:hypothetical protein
MIFYITSRITELLIKIQKKQKTKKKYHAYLLKPMCVNSHIHFNFKELQSIPYKHLKIIHTK